MNLKMSLRKQTLGLVKNLQVLARQAQVILHLRRIIPNQKNKLIMVRMLIQHPRQTLTMLMMKRKLTLMQRMTMRKSHMITYLTMMVLM